MHSRDVRLYLVGLAASVVGTSAMTLVAGVWVKTLTGSAAVAGLVSVCVYVSATIACFQQAKGWCSYKTNVPVAIRSYNHGPQVTVR